jgi:hypothetical protein
MSQFTTQIRLVKRQAFRRKILEAKYSGTTKEKVVLPNRFVETIFPIPAQKGSYDHSFFDYLLLE